MEGSDQAIVDGAKPSSAGPLSLPYLTYRLQFWRLWNFDRRPIS